MDNQNLRNQIIAKARQRIGTPFKHQGRKAGVGLDCIGLIVDVAKEFNSEIAKLDIPNYPRLPNKNKLKQTLDSLLVEIDINNAQNGDIILLSYGKEPQHVGFLTDSTIIHSFATVGRVVETSILKDDKRIVCAYSLINILFIE